jgi:hypothetical protein
VVAAGRVVVDKMKNMQGHQVDNFVFLQGFQRTVATPQPKPKTIAEIPARKAHQGKPGGLLSAHPARRRSVGRVSASVPDGRRIVENAL